MAEEPETVLVLTRHARADEELMRVGSDSLLSEVAKAVQALPGRSFEIILFAGSEFFDWESPERIKDARDGKCFLIPFLTPSFFRSTTCTEEMKAFLDLERNSGRKDLIFPVYLSDVEMLENAELRAGHKLAQALYEHGPADWRTIAYNDERIKQLVANLAKRIKEASDRVIDDTSPQIPNQQNYYRFRVNERGQIDRAPDDGPDVEDGDSEMLAKQAGLLDACQRFLDLSRGSNAGGNFFKRLIDVVDSYEAAISGPLSKVNFSEVWRQGSRLQNASNAVERQIKRLEELGEEFPELEDQQKAALDDLLTEHAPFVLSSSAGLEQQSLADHFNATKAEQEAKRAAGQKLNKAVQAEGTLFADTTKKLVAEISEEQGEGRYPERHAIIAEKTYQNLLAVTGKVAKFGAVAAAGGLIGNAAYDAIPIAKNLLDLSAPTIEAARIFWLSNQSALVALAAASGEALAWLPPFTDWLKGQVHSKDSAGNVPPPSPAIIKNNLWTPGRIFRDIDEPWCPEMVVIPAGKFMMGSPEDEKGRFENEGPQHLVTIEKPFALGRYPVTFDEFDFFCDQTNHPKPPDRNWGRDKRPVIYVSWTVASAYCDWLSASTGRTYRLPSEAEWEYACRAGTTTAYAFGDGIDKGEANFAGRVGMTLDVGAFKANAFGLYDMHGNVWEWCTDRYRDDYVNASTDGSPPLASDVGPLRVLRGGSWFYVARHLRSACRYRHAPGERNYDFGFRCVRVQET